MIHSNARDRGFRMSESAALNNVMPDGWYDDPATPNMERWWTGSEWTDHVRYTDKVRPLPAVTQAPALSIVEPSQPVVSNSWLATQTAIRPQLAIAEPSVEPFTPMPSFSPFDAPANSAPVIDAPVLNAPAYEAPAYQAPAPAAPLYEAPAYSAPASVHPAFSAPASAAPAFGAPAFGAPAFGSHGFNAPVFGTPAADAPASTGPVFTNPVPQSASWSAPTASTATFDDFYVPMRQIVPSDAMGLAPKPRSTRAGVLWVAALAVIGSAFGAGLWMFLPH